MLNHFNDFAGLAEAFDDGKKTNSRLGNFVESFLGNIDGVIDFGERSFELFENDYELDTHKNGNNSKNRDGDKRDYLRQGHKYMIANFGRTSLLGDDGDRDRNGGGTGKTVGGFDSDGGLTDR
jgi:hypothetical protein